jgi:hypothetical protein
MRSLGYLLFWAQQYLDGAALVHGTVPIGNLRKGQHHIEILLFLFSSS